MKEIRNILIPIDLSEESRMILDHALYFAEKLDAKKTIFHVLREPKIDISEMFLEEGFLEKMKKHQEEEAKRELEELIPVEYFRKYDIKTDMKWGEPYVEIVREAERIGADLIVMGTHGRSGFSHALLGSVAEKVLRLAPCPVVVVRSRKRGLKAEKQKQMEKKDKVQQNKIMGTGFS